jgi:outer membrane autotransporter protein
VDKGATLGGNGTLDGNLNVANGGHVAPGASGIGTLTVDGNATFAANSVLDYQFGAPGANIHTLGSGDAIDVGGNLTLDGVTLNVTNTGSMGPGLYNIFTYGGTLTESNGGLTIGSGAPANQNLQIQSDTGAKQINLLDSWSAALQFWDADGAPNGTTGGDGTWSMTSKNWTDANHDVDDRMTPQPGFAIFAGTPGTVRIDHHAGDISATGVQFAVDGYQTQGDALTLVADGGTNPTIRVGDGSSAGAKMTATVHNVLAGHDGLTKTDLGTLVLAGANTFSGGVHINGGTLSVSKDANLGDAGNAITLAGGTLENTAAFSSGRNVSLTDGTFQTDADLTASGVISGSGGLSKAGTGTLILTVANTYTGGTTIQAGTLEIGNGGKTGAITGDVTDHGELAFDRSDALVYSHVISGNGTVAQKGPGTLTLTGANTYTGGTKIAAGTVVAGNNTALGTGKVDMAAGTTLAFAQDGVALVNAFTLNGDPAVDVAGGRTGKLGGAIADGSSPGMLEKTGSGRLVLTGANTYTGGTTIQAGTLQIGAGGKAGSLSGDVTNHSVLVFDRGDELTFAGAISGTGSLIQQGAGTLVLTGANTYSGGTTVTAGTLKGNTQSLAGAIADHGALVFAQASDGVFHGTVSGQGALTKAGSGVLTLDGANPFTGNTTVAAGSLLVGDASHPKATLAGRVIVAKGATVGGHGTLGAVDTSGTVRPGGSIGTLHVTGDATFEPGSTFAIDAAPDGSADKLVVGGKTTIKSGSALVLTHAANYALDTQYVLIDAKGGISGQFSTSNDDLPFLDPKLGYQSNQLVFSLQRNQMSLASVAVTPNQVATATAADQIDLTNPLARALVQLDAPAARAAFDTLSGDLYASQQTARINDSRFIRQTMDQRLEQGHEDADSTHIAGTKVDAWAHAWGHWGTVDSHGNAAPISDNGDGLLIGADIPIGAQGRVGLTAGATRNSLRVRDSATSVRGTSQWLGAFAGVQTGALSWRGGIAYGWNELPFHRQVQFPGVRDRLTSSAAGSTITGYAEGAWTITFANGDIQPFLNVADTWIKSRAATETGGPAALHIAAQTETITVGTVGARGSWRVADRVNLHATIGWRRASGDTTPHRRLRFVAGGPAFDVQGVPVAKHAAIAKVGVGWKLAHNVRIDADYAGLWGDGSKDQAAKLNLSVRF